MVGKGLTEWSNEPKARPILPGHHRPHFLGDLGFYDLRVAEVREVRVCLPRGDGLHSFCYYHRWFNGRRILERLFIYVLASGKADLPFCLCWADENWTRAWDGGERDVLLEQKCCDEEDVAHVESVLPAFRDPSEIPGQV